VLPHPHPPEEDPKAGAQIRYNCDLEIPNVSQNFSKRGGIQDINHTSNKRKSRKAGQK